MKMNVLVHAANGDFVCVLSPREHMIIRAFMPLKHQGKQFSKIDLSRILNTLTMVGADGTLVNNVTFILEKCGESASFEYSCPSTPRDDYRLVCLRLQSMGFTQKEYLALLTTNYESEELKKSVSDLLAAHNLPNQFVGIYRAEDIGLCHLMWKSAVSQASSL